MELCTAGRNYVYVSHKGDISRCSYFHEHGKDFATIDNFPEVQVDLHCPLSDMVACEKHYLGDWNRSSRVDHDGHYSRGEFSVADDEIALKLCLTGVCNFSCHYCHPERNGAKKSEELPGEKWIQFIRKLRNHYRRSWYHVQGSIGEPFVYDDLVPVVREIVDGGDHLHLISNLSIREDRLAEILTFATPATVRCGASLHMTDPRFNWENFRRRVLMIRDSGIYVETLLVGVPTQLYLYERFRDEFAAEGVPLRMFNASMQSTTQTTRDSFMNLMTQSSSGKTVY